jgi:hypothetical protein
METKIGAGSALEPRPQSTPHHAPLARGYRPPRRRGLIAIARCTRSAVYAHLSRATTPRYGAGELYIAFVGGLVLAACALVPFLPHLAH